MPADFEDQTLDQLALLCLDERQLLPEIIAIPAPALTGFKTENIKFADAPGASAAQRARNAKKQQQPEQTKPARRKRGHK